MSDARWSLRRRTAFQFFAVVTIYLGLVGVGMSVAYRLILASELDEELTEQLDELRPGFALAATGPAAFEELVAPSGREGAETPMAWVAHVVGTGETWGPHGPDALTAYFEQAGPPLDRTVRIERVLRRRRSELANGVEVDVVLDGSDWIGRGRIADGLIAVIVVLGSLLSLVAGRVLGNRVATLVERVAAEVEGARGARGDVRVEIPGAPDEVRAVAESISASLARARSEIDRAKMLAAGLAHDLRAPVQSLLTSTQVALLAPPPDEATRELLDAHMEELRALGRTIDNLVAFGAPDVAASEETFVTFDLVEELESRLRGEEDEAARRGVFVDVEREGWLALRGDPGLLVLAVRNLVGNAIVWSPTGGQVLVRVADRGAIVEVAVEDEGPGVPADQRSRIFEPFVRGDAAPGRRAGYGLGLAIVAAAVERHGGRVAVSDAEGGGARFVLEIPRGDPQPASPPSVS
ncbi:MAG: HAMP domain-containing sensor histidine kinase [Planctomycetota bacterium]